MVKQYFLLSRWYLILRIGANAIIDRGKDIAKSTLLFDGLVLDRSYPFHDRSKQTLAARSGTECKGKGGASLFLLEAIYFGQHSFPDVLHAREKNYLTFVFAHERVALVKKKKKLISIFRFDFLILQLSSIDFVYIEKIIDTDRKNSITSEMDVMGWKERGG